MKNKKATRNFLIGQGCDTSFAEYLSRRYSLDDLKKKKLQELKDLGLRDAVREALNNGRIPIPPDMLNSVLQKNIRICCVCYNDACSVIVHHIKPYAKEKKHEESNLCVLCLQCHGRAHTKHEMEQNLTEAALLMHKQSWEAAIQHRKTWVPYANANGQPDDRWEWVNITRLQSIAPTMEQLVPTTVEREKLMQRGHLEEDGYTLRRDAKKTAFATDVGQDQSILAAYVAHLVEWIANQVPVLDVTPYCGQPDLLNNLLKPNMYICVRVEFRVMERQDGALEGIGRHQRVNLKFEFDRWNFTSSTSRIIGGKGNATSLIVFGIVRDVSIDAHNKDISINLSPIGLSTRYRPNDYFDPGYFQ